MRCFTTYGNGNDVPVRQFHGTIPYSKYGVPWSEDVFGEALISVTKSDFGNFPIRMH